MLAPRLPRPGCGFVVLASTATRRATTSVRLPLRRAVVVAVAVAVAGPRPFSNTRPRRSPDPYERLRSARPLVPDAIARRFTKAGRSRNSQAFAIFCVIAAVTFYLYNSQTVPVTGRRRFNFLSDKLVAQANVRAADAVIRQVQEQGGHFLSDWDPRTMLVKRVMKRLIPVSGMADLDWEIRVIADNRKSRRLHASRRRCC